MSKEINGYLELEDGKIYYEVEGEGSRHPRGAQADLAGLRPPAQHGAAGGVQPGGAGILE